ncbi:hypothetical protein F5Y11DRAFT_346596 [Daldinia sp. FL1419]|nr:hypothetical protein F5Y11DRAFT_346596 [Daldinia sp. FL1419]
MVTHLTWSCGTVVVAYLAIATAVFISGLAILMEIGPQLPMHGVVAVVYLITATAVLRSKLAIFMVPVYGGPSVRLHFGGLGWPEEPPQLAHSY